MLNDHERKWIYQRAYLPEHLPDYVVAVSGAEPYLQQNYLFFFGKKHLIFNAFALDPDSLPPARIYDAICDRFQPETSAVIAPNIWLSAQQYNRLISDTYYRLDLPLTTIKGAVAYMLRRARRELEVTQGSFGKEHQKLIKAFIAKHRFNRRQKYLFKHISQYVQISSSALLLEARKGKKLAAFIIIDLGSADFAFYLFSFRSSKLYVPGASDLLFFEMVNLAQLESKKAVNLGLGVSAGIRRFKEKWGGVSFLNYSSVSVDRRQVDIGALAKKL